MQPPQCAVGSSAASAFDVEPAVLKYQDVRVAGPGGRVRGRPQCSNPTGFDGDRYPPQFDSTVALIRKLGGTEGRDMKQAQAEAKSEAK
jgi:hypothetical protein